MAAFLPSFRASLARLASTSLPSTSASVAAAPALACTCRAGTNVRPYGRMHQSTSSAAAVSPSPASVEATSGSAAASSRTATASDASSAAQQQQQQQQQHLSNQHDTSSALALLRSQPSHYVVASLYQRSFLLTPRDVLTVPRLKHVSVGDIIRLDKVLEVGSRDYTLRASHGEVLGSDTVSVTATVIEHTKAKMERIEKFKKRKGYHKTIEHKGRYTRLRIGEITIGGGQQ